VGAGFPQSRSLSGLVDRLTDRAHVIETGTESLRFNRTLAGFRSGAAGSTDQDILAVPPGHDTCVVGDEPYVSLHRLGASEYSA
jgi:hypothetical protein